MSGIGARMRALREGTGLSQAKFGRMAGLSQATINRYETGYTAVPVKVLVWYADYFGVSLDDLCCRTGRAMDGPCKPGGNAGANAPGAVEQSPVEGLFHDISALPQVEAMALGGSRAGDAFDEKSDYDVYLYCTAPIEEDVRRTLLGRYCSVIEVGNHFWEYEDNCTLHNGIDIDILYRNLDGFTQDVASVAEDCRPRNGYTTCMWHNLRTCKIIYDPAGRLAAAKARFDIPYPPLLKARIIQRNRRLLRGSMPAYETQIAKAAARGDAVSVNHRTAAFLESYFDILFALNQQTHPGEKRLVQLCRRQCRILPGAFEENLERLFADLFVHTERVPEDIERIIDELERIL